MKDFISVKSNRWTIKQLEDFTAKREEEKTAHKKEENLFTKTTLKYSAKEPKNIPAPKISANVLTKHALRVLDLKGWNVWRQNNGGVYDPTNQCFRANSSTPGISDIIGFHKRTGQFIACEIKVGKDTLSQEQILFLDRVRRAGGVAMEVRTIDQLENL